MADLAARESEDKTGGTTCARCSAHIGAGEAYCPDCGAPTGQSTPSADSAVHGELAQANLLRMRGDLDGSEKLLLSILRRFPNDPHAHEMLGDVCAERGEGDRAIEWYELALDLAPNSVDVRRKLGETTTENNAKETADTAEVLGLPPTVPPAAWWPLGGAAALLVLAIAVAAWPRTPAPPTLHASLSAPTEAVVLPSTNPVPTPEPTAPVTAPPPTPQGVEEDQRLLTQLQALSDGSRVKSAMLDPRTQNVVVTFEVSDSDDPKAVALSLGREVLNAAPTAATVTLRAARAGNVVFAADLARADMDGTDPLTKVWPPANSDPTNTTVPPPATATGDTSGSGTAGSGGTTGSTSGSTSTGPGTTGAGATGSSTSGTGTTGSTTGNKTVGP